MPRSLPSDYRNAPLDLEEKERRDAARIACYSSFDSLELINLLARCLRLHRIRVDVPTNGTSETFERAMHTPVEIRVRIRPLGRIEFIRELIYPNTRPPQPNFFVSFVSRTFSQNASTYSYFPSYFFQQQECFLSAGIPTRFLRTSLTVPPSFPDI